MNASRAPPNVRTGSANASVELVQKMEK
jgi:hypothetical protein